MRRLLVLLGIHVSRGLHTPRCSVLLGNGLLETRVWIVQRVLIRLPVGMSTVCCVREGRLRIKLGPACVHHVLQGIMHRQLVQAGALCVKHARRVCCQRVMQRMIPNAMDAARVPWGRM